MGLGGTIIGALESGFSSLLNPQTKWKLYNTDSGEIYEGQFGPIGLTKDLGSQVGTFSSLNRQDPIVQWLGGTGEMITFDALLFSQNFLRSIGKQLTALEKLVKKNFALGRPPVCRFTYGKEMSMLVIVESLGGIRYADSRPLIGTFRSAMLTITLRKYVPYSPVETAETPTETYYRPARINDTYETIAKQAYGSAVKGVNLRARFPKLDIVIPSGEIVPVLEQNNEDILAPTAPVSDVFLGVQRDPDILQDALDARSKPFLSTVQVA